MSSIVLRPSDGQSMYLVGDRLVAGKPQRVVVALRLANGEENVVLRVDEPSRPHAIVSNGIAEYGGWMYFTLSDFQSDVWVATVMGLKE